MIITFKDITFKNILSYGANETKIVFSKGINLISGKNGNGKSVFLDALSFCLFGKPYRNIKIKELINRKNRKNLEVSCTFTIDHKDVVEVKRTLAPDSLEIKKNNAETNILSSKKLNQEELNKIIGIDYSLFKQVISLAVNYNKPFLSLPSQEKRDIIEQIFNITVFGQMLKEAKKKNADNLIKNELNISTLKLNRENLRTLEKNIKEIKLANVDFEKNKEQEITTITERINKYEENINIINNSVNEITTKSNNISIEQIDKDINTNKTTLEEITKIINTQEYSIETKTKTITNLEIDVVCPRCLTKLTAEHKELEIKELNKEILVLQDQLQTKQIEQQQIQTILENLVTAKQDYDKLQTNKLNLIDKQALLQSELNHLKDNKQQIIDRKVDINTENIITNFNTKISEYKSLYKNAKNIKTIIDNYDVVFNILSESGIKAFFFKKLIPILNVKINEYLQLFEIPVILLFDDFMNEKISSCENMKREISYNAYSEGEKKRVDMAILLSFISMTKAISNWSTNLLLIDELLDGAIDENGLDKLVTSLKNMTYDSDMCIYIISHRLQQDYSSKFNSCLQIEKNDSFSKITYI